MKSAIRKNKAILVIQELERSGLGFPVHLGQIIHLLPGKPAHVIRSLAQKGYIANPELYDGGLPLGTAQRLEKIGVFDRDTLREMLEAGRLNLEAISFIGRRRRESIMKWARLNPEECSECTIRLKLSANDLRRLREFAGSKEYPGMHDVIRAVLDKVLSAAGGQAKKSGRGSLPPCEPPRSHDTDGGSTNEIQKSKFA